MLRLPVFQPTNLRSNKTHGHKLDLNRVKKTGNRGSLDKMALVEKLGPRDSLPNKLINLTYELIKCMDITHDRDLKNRTEEKKTGNRGRLVKLDPLEKQGPIDSSPNNL